MNDELTFWDLVNNWKVLLTASVAILLFIANQFVNRYGQIPLKDEIKDRENWPHLIERFQQTRRAAYFATMTGLLNKASKFYGDGLLKTQSLVRCWQVAFIYPLAAILIGWAFGNVHTLGDLDFFPSDTPAADRLEGMMRILASSVVIFFVFKFLFKCSFFLDRKLASLRLKLIQVFEPLKWVEWAAFPAAGFLVGVILIVIGILLAVACALLLAGYSANMAGSMLDNVQMACAIIGAGTGAISGTFSRANTYTAAILMGTLGIFVLAWSTLFAGDFAIIVAVVVVGVVTLAFAMKRVFTFAGAVFAAFATASVFSALLAQRTPPEVLTFVVLFFAVFPLLNGFADWLSLAATRFFLGRAVRHQHGVQLIFVNLGKDVLVAVSCLCGLLLVIWSTLLVWQAVSPQTLSFDWRGYWNAALAGEPWQRWPLYLMASTTLAPTMVHLTAGLGAFWAAESKSMHEAVALMQAHKDDESFRDLNRIIARIGRGQLFAYARAAIMVSATVVGLGWILINFVPQLL